MIQNLAQGIATCRALWRKGVATKWATAASGGQLQLAGCSLHINVMFGSWVSTHLLQGPTKRLVHGSEANYQRFPGTPNFFSAQDVA